MKDWPNLFITVMFVAFMVVTIAAGAVGLVLVSRMTKAPALEATWVSEAHAGGISKSGRIWLNEEWTAAMKGTSELGKWKRVALADQPERVVYVLVTDRLPDKAHADIDLSMGAAHLLGGDDLLRRGRFNVNVEDAK